MRVFAISDLHLALAEDKPMDIFGPDWENYMQRIQINWHQTISKEDLVLLPGDLSWAMYLDDAGPDFQFIEALPGKKIISKGNHDYWWTTHNKLKLFLERENFTSMDFLQNNAFFFDGFAVVGSRGWKSPGEDGFTAEDDKIYNREIERLKLSLEKVKAFQGTVIAMLHYPPFGSSPNGFVDLLKAYDVSICVYGHLHGNRGFFSTEGMVEGIRYHLVSADHLKFSPLLLGEW